MGRLQKSVENSKSLFWTNSVSIPKAIIGNGKLITVRYRYSLARIMMDSDSLMLLREQALRDLTVRIFGRALVKHAVFYMEIQTPCYQQRREYPLATNLGIGK